MWFLHQLVARCWEVTFDEQSKDNPYHLITQGPQDVDFYISYYANKYLYLSKSFTKFIIDEKIPRGDKKSKKVGYRQLIRVLNALQGIMFYHSYKLIKHLWNDRDKWVSYFKRNNQNF